MDQGVRKGAKRMETTKKERLCYIRPVRAFRRMKSADEDSQTVYIFGVTGIGKTELFTRYLDGMEYRLLNGRKIDPEALKPEKKETRQIIVIDDLHDLVFDPNQEEIKERITKLAVREDIWLILAGRSPVPPWLAPIRYREMFCIINEERLLFDERMEEQYVSRRNMILTEKQLAIMKAYCHGVPVGWQVSSDAYERFRQLKKDPSGPFDEQEFEILIENAKDQMWDYLEYHVYDQWEVQLQEFLMEVSIVDRFTIRLAEMITGRLDVEMLVEKSKWLGNFMVEDRIGKETCYYLREEMLTSMRRRLKKRYSMEKQKKLYENAGLYYQLKREPMKALAMYEAVGDMERIASILVDNARMTPNNGYYYELKKYYLELPEERILESPELMKGLSMLQSLLLNISESERWYQELKEYEKKYTGSQKRAAREQLLYLDIALPHRGIEGIAEILKEAYDLLKENKVHLQEFSVTANLPSLMNGEKDFCDWSFRDIEIMQSMEKILEGIFGSYGKGLANLAIAESMFEKGGDNYEVAMLANKGRMQADAGGRIEQCFVGDGILSWLHIINGKASEAEDLLKRFYRKAEQEGAERLFANIRTFLARCYLYEGKTEEIKEWMEKAPDEEMGFCIYDRFQYLTKARCYLLEGRNEQAYNLLIKCDYYAKIMKRPYLEMEGQLLAAIAEYRMGKNDWDLLLKKALTEIEHYGFVRIVTREGAALLPLVHKTSWKPTEPEENKEQAAKNRQFWKKVQAELEKMAQFYPSYLDSGIEEVYLSDTMMKILRLQAEGLSKEKIAEELNMSVSNVKYHTQQIYRKLRVSNKAEAVREAGRRGWI